MRFSRMKVALAAAGITASGVVAGMVVAAAPASAGPARALTPAASQVVLVQCNGHGQVEPRGYNIGCMPSNVLMTKLRWVSWHTVAYGSGILAVNNCTPSSSCGLSKFTRYPILIVLWRAATWHGHPGKHYFSRMTYILDGKRPSGVAATHTSVLPAYK
jgi:hypothetical protein